MRAVTELPSLVMAVDPGLITGVATYNPATGLCVTDEVDGGALGFAAWFRAVLGSITLTHVVVEDFIITQATLTNTRQYDPLYIIGWLGIECFHLGIPFTKQTPSNGKAFGTDDKLKHLGWYVRTPGGHRNDAARHLVTYLAKKDRALVRRLGEML